MFIDSGKIHGVLGKKPPLMKTKKNLKLIKLEMNGKVKFSRLEDNQTSLGRLIVTNIVDRVSYINLEIKDIVSG